MSDLINGNQRNMYFYQILQYGEDILTHAGLNIEHELYFDFIKQSVKSNAAKTKNVVTHHTPSLELVLSDFEDSLLNGTLAANLRNYIAQSGIDYWIYSHFHDNATK